MITQGIGIVAALSVLATTAAPHVTDATTESEFTRVVVNLEYDARNLSPDPPPQLRAGPEGVAQDELFHGVVPRRLPGDASKQHFIPFAVRYRSGVPASAWCDTNLNGDLSDDPAVKLSGYPGMADGRSFLADFEWTASLESGAVPVEWKIRVVLEPQVSLDRPRYRLQKVFGMLGEVTVEGRTHRALLQDANHDGIYSNAFPDGMFVDMDDDLHFTLDPMSPDFAPFSVPFQWGRREYVASVADPLGRRISLKETRGVDPIVLARVGEAAPAFSFVDTTGATRHLDDYRGRVVLIYFWSSQCGSCANQAVPLKKFYDRARQQGVEILAVSYDTDLEAMTAFREDYGHEWPTSYTGRKYWENSIGRQYQAGGAGMIYLVSPEGVLEGIYSNIDDLEAGVSRYSELESKGDEVLNVEARY